MSVAFCRPLLFFPSLFAYMLYVGNIQLPPGAPGACPPTFGVVSIKRNLPDPAREPGHGGYIFQNIFGTNKIICQYLSYEPIWASVG